MRILMLLLAGLALLAPAHARADERILHFLSDVSVERNGTLDVVETIDVRSEGIEIRRGILRDFPTRYQDRLGREVRVGFNVEGVERDGHPEPWSTEALGNGVRVRIGDPDILLDPGEHSYRIHYTTTRQIGFFDDYDELYWNATGNGWAFPIDVAEARIRLPEKVPFGKRAVYTGAQGSRDRNAEVVSEKPGEILFRTTTPLGAEEGMTVAVAWPKGVVTPPSSGTKAGYWLADNGPWALALIGVAMVLAYYFYAWRAVGRGPREGTIMPLFAPPDHLSAAASRYVSRMGYDDRAFAAALVELGVHRKLRLREEDDSSSSTMIVERTGDPQGLPPPEAAMMKELFADGDSIEMKNSNHERFEAAQKALGDGLKQAYQGRLFITNLRWSLVGLGLVLFVITAVGASVIFTDPSGPPLLFALSVPAAAMGAFILIAIIDRKMKGAKARWAAVTLEIILAVIGFVAAVFTMIMAVESGRPFPLILPMIVGFAVALTAFFWMAAPTVQGRAVMDRIAGFRRYLSVTEEDRLERMNPPKQTPELFERYLPYAIALGVENKWASRFTAILAAAAAAGHAQSFVWYSGNHSPWSDPGGFADRIGDSLTSSVSSASSAPGSSSGSSGGGFSGGGGGGGGGGGW